MLVQVMLPDRGEPGGAGSGALGSIAAEPLCHAQREPLLGCPGLSNAENL